MNPRTARLLSIACFCLAAAACGTSTANTPSSTSTVAGVSQAPASASPTPTLQPGQLEILALDALSTSAAGMARDLGDSIGVAVYIPSESRIYQYNAEPPFGVASVMKVPIMLTVMDRAVKERRVITDEETALIRAMITESDNDATTVLWDLVGGASAIEGYLASVDIQGAEIDAEDWGESKMSAAAGAQLMGKLVNGELLDAPHSDYALELLTEVNPVQDWGAVVAGTFEGRAGVKNGWYPEYEGWVLASVGYVVPDDGNGPTYTIAVFTDRWLHFNEGVRAIESIASLIRTDLFAD